MSVDSLSFHKPELVAPAGDLGKLKAAVCYGADAVYLSGPRFGLRARADHLSDDALVEGLGFAHARGVKVYVVLNAFLRDEDLAGLGEYCGFLEECGVDAVLVSDLGVLRCVQRSSRLPLHLSTQASCLNHQAALLWREVGVRRIVLGREVSIQEAGCIYRQTGVALEIFVHGALCMSFGGHCLISNFTAARDANRGGCVHACRFGFELESRPGKKRHFLSSKDLCAVDWLEAISGAGIAAVKIEGRMKSLLYVATACKVYRRLLDAAAAEKVDMELLKWARDELSTVPHREFCEGSLLKPAGAESVYSGSQNTSVNSTAQMLGTVLEIGGGRAAIRLLAPLGEGEVVEFITFRGETICWRVKGMTDITGKALPFSRQEQVVCMPYAEELRNVQVYTLLRRRTGDVG